MLWLPIGTNKELYTEKIIHAEHINRDCQSDCLEDLLSIRPEMLRLPIRTDKELIDR